MKRAMIDAAAKRYLIADSTKIGKASLASFGLMSCVDALITDDGVDRDVVSRIEKLGVKVIIAT